MNKRLRRSRRFSSWWFDDDTANCPKLIVRSFYRQQDLANYMDVKDYRNAIVLALSMDQPRRLFNLLSDILSDTSSMLSTQSSTILTEVFASLNSSDIFRLLGYIRDWNSKSRDSDTAQSALHVLLKTQSSSSILKAAPVRTGLEIALPSETAKESATKGSIADIIEALMPYTERHYARAERLHQESAFLDFVLAQMDDYAVNIDSIASGVAHANGETSFDASSDFVALEDLAPVGR